MGNISLWDEGITKQTITVCDNNFPLNEVSLPRHCPQFPFCPGATGPQSLGWLGPVFYCKRRAVLKG